ncbi:ABC transporter ATP-binding protein [Thermomicrobium sp. 4228-Ro]|uniref:ABC transporter ATP-binding protein n=1 Tax=Thermomicrobium sp. 4228-Ro TaxID=2993937 RepID=UPI0022496DD5|nr:ABC transporter ATP-binding protein [Thermomicrobium sp. 4228-Ro]MCX2727990.1 ABC transporter ATP-binding protein [Thermomicrobium sp. 4228-Ro]
MIAVQSPRLQTATHALELQGVSRRFGGLVAVREVSLALQPGERRAIIGPNGAGKTTLFNVITGELRPTAGTIRFFGRDVTHLPPYQRIRLGLARTYQTPLVFRRLTVAENLYLAVRGVRPWRLSLRLPRRSDPEFREVEELAERVGLGHALRALAGALSHGEQRQLELGMALASRPKLLLLDEPAAGLSPGEREQLTALLQGLDPRMTVLLIEHDMDVAFQVVQRVTVLHEGSVIAEGAPDEIAANPVVQAVYLGGGYG